ncbi:MAG: hypothetical protein J0M17_07435, partial [Planctomycetes bacterium]|nr:hypothetical protein [Planctomycetota bacterium]
MNEAFKPIPRRIRFEHSVSPFASRAAFMPRRNLYILVFVLALSFVCYHKADSANRAHYEPMFDVFKTAMSQIRDHYLYKVDERKLFEGAMKGMAAELDQYSGYSGYEDTRKFDQNLRQEFFGVGIE